MVRRMIVVLAVALVLAGCSSSHSSTEGTSTTTPGGIPLQTAPTIKRPTADDPAVASYCQAWRSIAAVGPLNTEGDAPTIARSIQEHYSKVLPLATQLQQVAPEEIRDVVSRAVQVIQQAMREQTLDALHNPANAANGQRMLEYSERHCAA